MTGTHVKNPNNNISTLWLPRPRHGNPFPVLPFDGSALQIRARRRRRTLHSTLGMCRQPCTVPSRPGRPRPRTAAAPAAAARRPRTRLPRRRRYRCLRPHRRTTSHRRRSSRRRTLRSTLGMCRQPCTVPSPPGRQRPRTVAAAAAAAAVRCCRRRRRLPTPTPRRTLPSPPLRRIGPADSRPPCRPPPPSRPPASAAQRSSHRRSRGRNRDPCRRWHRPPSRWRPPRWGAGLIAHTPPRQLRLAPHTVPSASDKEH
eukprot:COSAG04_NODE_1301_length_7315_cov_12.447755_5_plen_257_part_00